MLSYLAAQASFNHLVSAGLLLYNLQWKRIKTKDTYGSYGYGWPPSNVVWIFGQSIRTATQAEYQKWLGGQNNVVMKATRLPYTPLALGSHQRLPNPYMGADYHFNVLCENDFVYTVDAGTCDNRRKWKGTRYSTMTEVERNQFLTDRYPLCEIVRR